MPDDTEILGANNPTQPTTPNHPPKPRQPLVNQLEVLDPSLGLDLIDSQSSYHHFQEVGHLHSSSISTDPTILSTLSTWISSTSRTAGTFRAISSRIMSTITISWRKKLSHVDVFLFTGHRIFRTVNSFEIYNIQYTNMESWIDDSKHHFMVIRLLKKFNIFMDTSTRLTQLSPLYWKQPMYSESSGQHESPQQISSSKKFTIY